MIKMLALLLLLSPTLAHAEQAPIVIDDDGGGEVETYIAWYHRLKVSGTPVILRGICDSACGFVLMLPHDQVCIEPTASLGFHLAANGHMLLPDYSAALFRRYVPPAVQDWLADKKLTSVMVYMTATEVVDRGVFPACPE